MTKNHASFLRGLFSGSLFFINTIFWCVLMMPLALLKAIVPLPAFQAWLTEIMVRMAELWISGNNCNIRLTQNIQWDIRLPQSLDRTKSYMITANHQSWMDIVILQYVFNRRLPFIRFFLKQELLYVPLLGIAWWALDYPFMKRYSKEYLAKHPEKRGKDLETTRKATEKFRRSRVTILNFLEGTRWTKEKHLQQKSSYQNLLTPKAGGVAFVLQSMGDQFASLVDVTIVYPDKVVSLWQALKGELTRVVVDVREIPLPRQLVDGSYMEDPKSRGAMREWVSQIWKEKDQRISHIRSEETENLSAQHTSTIPSRH